MLCWVGRVAWYFALGVALTALVLGAFAGDLAVLVVTAGGLTHDLGPVAGPALFLVAVPLTFALAVLAHEAGHLVAGRVLGLSPRFAHVGPVTLTRVDGQWRLG